MCIRDRSIVAGEMRNPEKNVPRAILGSISIVSVLYMLIIAGTIAMLGGRIMQTGAPVQDAFVEMIGPIGAPLVSYGALIDVYKRQDIHHGVSVNWLGYVYRFVVGKAATPFYYIVVLIQLTVITPSVSYTHLTHWDIRYIFQHILSSHAHMPCRATGNNIDLLKVFNFVLGDFHTG